MKFSCYKADLNEALAFVNKAVAVKPQTPILSGIFVTASNGIVELQSNNFNTGIITKIPANVEVPGMTVVSGKRFVEFARNMPDDTITLTLEQNLLTLNSGGADVNLLTMDPDDFPKVQSVPSEKTFNVDMATLGNLIRKTIFAVATNDQRPMFTGVNFNVNGEYITLAATNTSRLAVAKDRLQSSCPPCNFIVPADTLRNITSKLFKENAETVEVNLTERKVSFAFDNNLVTARLIEGYYPDYKRVIPENFATSVNVNTAEFRNAVSFIAPMARDTQYNTVKLDVSSAGIEVSANSAEVGNAFQSVECLFSGDDLEIHFNVDYVADVFKAVSGNRLDIKFNDRFSPAQFTCPDDPDFIYVATPVRT